MDEWFIREWHTERDANRAFREDVIKRLTALETTNEVEDEIATKGAQSRVNWVTIVISAVAVVISLLALI